VDVNADIVTTGYFRGLGFQPHRHKTILKKLIIRDIKSLEDEGEGVLVSIAF
jgi:hypothetical protein